MRMKNRTMLLIAGLSGSFILAMLVVLGSQQTPSGIENDEAVSQIVYKTAQREPFSIDRWTQIYDTIVVGKIVSVDAKVIDESFTVNNTQGESIYHEMKTPYQFVTIEVEKYLKDSAGTNSEQLTFRDFANGYVILDGQKTSVVMGEGPPEYKIDERALFFITNAGDFLLSDGYADKFTIDEASGRVQSKLLESKGVAAMTLMQLESEIDASLKKQILANEE